MNRNIKLKELSIVIPIYNEEKNIRRLSNKIKKNLRIKKYEIIFIDDNSQDGSHKILRYIKKKNKKINYIIRKQKFKDLSQSCILGFKLSKYKNIIVMDGDLQHDPIYIPSLINKYNKTSCDIVVGCRNFFEKDNQGLSFFRTLSSVILILIINLFLGKKTSDPMSGFFLFQKKIYTKQKKKLYKRGYKILADLIYNNKTNINIKDVKIKFKKRNTGKSKLNLKVLFYLLFFIFKKIF